MRSCDPPDAAPPSMLPATMPASWFAALAQAAPLPMAVLDETGALLFANPAFQAHAQGFLARLDPKALRAARDGGDTTHQQGLRIGPATGPARVWDLAFTPLTTSGPGCAPLLITAQDVTGQTEAVENAARLRAVLTQIQAAIFVIEPPDGRITLQSDHVGALLGNPDHDLARAQAALRGWAVHPDGTPYAVETYPSRRALRGERILAEPMLYRRGDGSLVHLAVYAGPVHDRSGAVIASVTTLLDVTGRDRALSALRDSEDRLRVAMAAGGLGTWELDLDRGRLRLGTAMTRMLGRRERPTEMTVAWGLAFIHAEDRARVAAEIRAAAVSGQGFASECRIRLRGGTTRWMLLHGRADQAGGGRLMGVASDITEQVAREQRLSEAMQARELLHREADHRIKNSLQLVSSLLGLQRTRLSDRDALAALDSAMLRVQAIAETHKALQQSADLRHIALGAMLRDLCRTTIELAPTIRLTCLCPEEIELEAERAIPLGLILNELLTNAVKYAYPAGHAASGTPAVALRVATASDGLVVTVSDAGIGLPVDKPEGAGLGMLVVRALCTQIGAALRIQSAPGAGTTATLHLGESSSVA